MTSPIAGTLKGTFNIVWKPIRYPVRWADSPEEVPPWDQATGFDRGQMYIKTQEDLERSLYFVEGGRELTESEAKRFLALPIPDRIKFPRLVRSTPYSMEYIPRELRAEQLNPQNSSEDASLAVANLSRYVGETEEFKQEVLRVANCYAPLEVGELSVDTLDTWIDLSRELMLLWNLIRQVKEDPALYISEDTNNSFWQDDIIEPLKSKEHDSLKNIALIRGSPVGRQAADWGLDLSPQEFVIHIREYLWMRFSVASSFRQFYLGNLGTLELHCGLLTWSFYELFEAFGSSKHAKICKECRRLFLSIRSDAETCSGKCKKQLSRNRKRGLDV